MQIYRNAIDNWGWHFVSHLRDRFPKLVCNAKNLQRTSNKLTEIILRNLKRPIACFETKATATKAELHNPGAAVLAPLGALGFTSGDNSGQCV
jgi:hypothetical protein